MKPIVIVGAGITGCVIGSELARRNHTVILIEKEAQVGGLARTFRYGDFSFDIGPHRFFSQKKHISDYILNILKDGYSIVPRDSVVHFLGKYYSWPLRPAAVFDLPCAVTLKSGWDLFQLMIKNHKKGSDSFEDYILKNYGPSLYNVFFKDYTQKFLGFSPGQVHFDWAREGMKKTIIDESIVSRNLFDILKLFFVFKPRTTEFIYPEEGIDVFCKRLAQDITGHGGEILHNSAITHITQSPERIEAIFLKNRSITPAMVLWTAPIGTLCNLLQLPCTGLDYLSLLLFNVEINKPSSKHFQWCYYGDKDIVFSRVTMPASFSKKMAPGQKGSFCVEVACREGDRQWRNPEILLERVKSDLMKVGLVDHRTDTGKIFIEKISDAYPIYALTYPRELEKVKANLSTYKNLALAGRTGLFWYNNMDDCIENGLAVVEGITRQYDFDYNENSASGIPGVLQQHV